MPRLTNRLGIPAAVADAVARSRSEYDRGYSDATVTQLLSPPRVVALEAQYGDELEEDVSDLIYSLWGSTIHKMFEEEEKSASTEERVYLQVNGWMIGGKFDRFEPDTGLLQDFKQIKVDELRYGLKEEKAQQLNVLAHILRANGHVVTKLEAVCILRDHSKVRAANDPSYPQSPIALVELPLWSPIEAECFIRDRVTLHQNARVELPECTPEERWASPTKWAVMKKGGKRAVRLCDWEREAELFVASQGPEYYVEERPGTSIRCSWYCSAAPVCTQWAALRDNKTSKEDA